MRIHTSRNIFFALLCLISHGSTFLVPRRKPGISSNSGPLSLTILHTNDIHSHFDEFNHLGIDCTDDLDCYGSIPRLKTLVDSIRNTTQDFLFLDAGDQFQGTLFYNFYKGEKITYLMNEVLKYDAMTVGNHEFDDGEELLADFINTLKFPVVASNIDLDTAPFLKKTHMKPYHIFPKYGLAVIGSVTNSTGSMATGAREINFQEPAKMLQKYVDEINAKGIKKIICLSHNGYPEDQYIAAKYVLLPLSLYSSPFNAARGEST